MGLKSLLRLEPSVASQKEGDGGNSEQAGPALVVESRALFCAKDRYPQGPRPASGLGAAA